MSKDASETENRTTSELGRGYVNGDNTRLGIVVVANALRQLMWRKMVAID